MSINLSDLTSPNNQDSLAEITSGADFLDPIGKLKNLSRSPNSGSDALQTVALDQPKALPLIDGDGYLYLSGISGNHAQTPDDSSLDITGDLVIDVDVTMKSWTPTSNSSFCGKYQSSGDQRSFRLLLRTDKRVQFYFSDDGTPSGLTGAAFSTELPFSDNQRGQVRMAFNSSTGIVQFFTATDKGQTWTQLGPDRATGKASIYNSTADVYVGSYFGNSELLDDAAIHSVKFYDSVTPSSSSLRFNCDFTATNVRHGDTKIKCATGQIVTINQDSSSSNDVATIIKKAVLRFDGVNGFMNGLLNQTVTGGYLFAAFSVLGDSGGGAGRVVGFNSTGINDNSAGGYFLARSGSSEDLNMRYNGGFNVTIHEDVFDEAFGDMLLEARFQNGSHISKLNNANEANGTATVSGDLSSEEFVIASYTSGTSNAAIDLEFLALFSADSVPDEATASKIRDYINKRNQIYLRHQTDGFFFFDPQKLAAGDVTSWNGNITGSDLGDTDVATNVTIVQGSQTSQPNADGYSLTFEDNTQHLEWASAYTPNFPAGQTKAWQIVGTSLGTFAYLTQGSVTELTLLGNANTGATPYRRTGDLYGIILLPESATGADIEQARSLLIDRGAADGFSASIAENYFRERDDMVEFKGVSFSGVTNVTAMFFGSGSLTTFNVNSLPDATSIAYAFRGTGLTSFHTQLPLVTNASNSFYGSNLEAFGVQLPEATRVEYAFYNCSSLSDFTTTDIKKCVNFTSAWHNCSALTSFPAGAKLGTEANNVNFTTAFQSSGLTSFPALDLSNGKNFVSTFASCSNLTSIEAGVLFSANANNIVFYLAFSNCTSLVDFPPAAFDSLGTPAASCFLDCWSGCAALSANSVENILVSINTSGKSAPSTNPQITIDYNTATGSLSAATNAAIDSLSGKGWEVYINGVLVIPNILDLEPAAAYSLRSFDADADPNVVNVRRSSDSATSDFKASEVSDGTLTDWVNTDVVITSSDFASTLSPFSLYNDTLTTTELNQSIAGVDGALKITFGGDTAFLRRAGSQTLGIGKQFKVSVKVYLPSSNDYVDGLTVSNTGLTNEYPTTTLAFDTWHTIEFTGVANVTSKTSGFRLYAKNRASSVDDVMYVKDYDITQLTADGHVTTWYDQGGTNHAAQIDDAKQPKIVDGGTLVTEGGLPSINFHTEVSNLSLNHSDIYGQATLDSYYVTNATGDAYLYPSLLSTGNAYGMVAASTAGGGNNSTTISTNYGSPTFYANGTEITGTTRGDIYAATSGGRKLVGHQGADTSNTAWSSGSVNFGNFTFSATAFGFTGKLQEMIFFNTDQSANRTGIENNINDTYTIY